MLPMVALHAATDGNGGSGNTGSNDGTAATVPLLALFQVIVIRALKPKT